MEQNTAENRFQAIAQVFKVQGRKLSIFLNTTQSHAIVTS